MKWCIVGISQYIDENIPDLIGVENSVEKLNMALTKDIEISTKDILILSNETRDEIIQKMGEFLEKAEGEDFIFYFCGHGMKAGKELYMFATNTSSILDPDLTASAPFKLTAYHGACIIIQALEQYFCQTQDTPIQDGFIETICRTVICSLKMLKKDMDNGNARGQLLWAGALVTNRILGRGKEAPWMAGPLGNIIEEKAGLDYTTGIAITFPKYMMVCYKDCLPLFVQFAMNVMNVNPERKCDNQIAREGAEALQKIFDDLGLAHSLKELGKDFTSYEEFREEIDAYAAKGVISKEDLQEIVQLSIG